LQEAFADVESLVEATSGAMDHQHRRPFAGLGVFDRTNRCLVKR